MTTTARQIAKLELRIQEVESELARLRARLRALTTKPSAKAAPVNRAALRMFGVDPRGLSAAELAKGAAILGRLTREPCGGGRPPNKAKAAAEWEAFFNAAAKKPRTADRHREPNRDRHSPGYMRDYMRRRRAAAALTNITNV
jgi:hypothetical protein